MLYVFRKLMFHIDDSSMHSLAELTKLTTLKVSHSGE